LLTAHAHAELGEFDDGALAYQHVVEQTARDDARNIEAREGLALLELRRGNLKAAVDGYRQLLEEATTPGVRDEREFTLATMYMESGDTARGRMMLRQILGGYELNAYRSSAAFLLADSYYADGRMAQAAKYYKWALSDFSSYEGRIPALFRAADAYMRLSLYDEALAMVHEVPKAHDPEPTPQERARAQLLAGESLLLEGQYGLALEELYGALVGQLSEADRQRVAYRIGQCYYASGHYSEALDAFDTALEQAPQHPLAFEATLAVADCYVKKGWLDDARQHYMTIIEAASQDDTPEQAAAHSAVVFKLLDTYSDRGLYQDELHTARTLLEGGYAFLDEARLTYRMARAYERLNNAAQAEALYADVRTRFPGTTWARQADVKLRHIQMLEQIETLSK
jgi:TolA-binding protein